MIERLAGVDEVGRGPLAGAVVAAAVILDINNPIKGLTDSKLLNSKTRERLADEIKAKALAWALGRAEVEEIDRLNIFQASLLAMQRAVMGLGLQPTKVVVDGTHAPDLPYATQAIVKGDLTVMEISAASIIAKVTRDAEMIQLDSKYPGYGFANHKGYGTAEHLAALRSLKPCVIHRRSFAPVRNLLSET